MIAHRCDVNDCPILLEEKKGFEVQTSLYILDRSDRDSDAVVLTRHACSHKHALALLKEANRADEVAFANRFTKEGKAARSAPRK